MKKIIGLFLSGIVFFSLTGCDFVPGTQTQTQTQTRTRTRTQTEDKVNTLLKLPNISVETLRTAAQAATEQLGYMIGDNQRNPFANEGTNGKQVNDNHDTIHFFSNASVGLDGSYEMPRGQIFIKPGALDISMIEIVKGYDPHDLAVKRLTDLVHKIKDLLANPEVLQKIQNSHTIQVN